MFVFSRDYSWVELLWYRQKISRKFFYIQIVLSKIQKRKKSDYFNRSFSLCSHKISRDPSSLSIPAKESLDLSVLLSLLTENVCFGPWSLITMLDLGGDSVESLFEFLQRMIAMSVKHIKAVIVILVVPSRKSQTTFATDPMESCNGSENLLYSSNITISFLFEV